ncbi:hypothetical protein [Herbidospora mongoliensis]|nr:hypothetical protein [Herbidospora mongoliensis]
MTAERPEPPSPEPEYEPPALIRLGRVTDLFGGNSSSGNADANSDYYW